MDNKTYIYSCYIDLPVMALSSVGFCVHIWLLLALEHRPHGRTSVHSNGNFLHSARPIQAVSADHDASCTSSCFS